MDKEKAIKWLSNELAKRDRESLCREVSTMTFLQAYEKLGGYSLCQDDISESFDVNYKSISTTIFCTNRGNCEVHNVVDIWLEDETAPITITM